MTYYKFLIPFFALALLCSCTADQTSDTYYDSDSPDSPNSPSAMNDTDTEMNDSEDTMDTDVNMVTTRETVILQTSEGDIEIEVFGDLAPRTATNFVRLAEEGYYEDIQFHRVIPGFMIQGGDPTATGAGGQSIYGATFDDEIDPSSELYQIGYKEGVVAMANRGPNTNGSQFFIMDADYPLPPSYTIFGRVTAGQDVVNAIANVDRDSSDRPLEPVTFTAEVQE